MELHSLTVRAKNRPDAIMIVHPTTITTKRESQSPKVVTVELAWYLRISTNNTGGEEGDIDETKLIIINK